MIRICEWIIFWTLSNPHSECLSAYIYSGHDETSSHWDFLGAQYKICVGTTKALNHENTVMLFYSRIGCSMGLVAALTQKFCIERFLL